MFAHCPPARRGPCFKFVGWTTIQRVWFQKGTRPFAAYKEQTHAMGNSCGTDADVSTDTPTSKVGLGSQNNVLKTLGVNKETKSRDEREYSQMEVLLYNSGWYLPKTKHSSQLHKGRVPTDRRWSEEQVFDSTAHVFILLVAFRAIGSWEKTCCPLQMRSSRGEGFLGCWISRVRTHRIFRGATSTHPWGSGF